MNELRRNGKGDIEETKEGEEEVKCRERKCLEKKGGTGGENMKE